MTEVLLDPFWALYYSGWLIVVFLVWMANPNG